MSNGNPNRSLALPWFRVSRSEQAGCAHIVTWWIAKRNRRGTATLWPHCVAFPTEQAARQAATERAHARKVTYRYARGAEIELK